MVRDAYYYAIPLLAAAAIVGWLTRPAWAVLPVLLAVFFLWFFRDPERQIPAVQGAIVSPADGRITDVSLIERNGEWQKRISIFLNVFNVHVNRSPITGIITSVQYKKGQFRNAMGAVSADLNEQNVVTVEGDAGTVVFKQIAGLLARRIVFTRKTGDQVARGERIGLIKFGSRVDVIFAADADMKVKVGDNVKGGSSLLAVAQPRPVPSSLREAVEAR